MKKGTARATFGCSFLDHRHLALPHFPFGANPNSKKDLENKAERRNHSLSYNYKTLPHHAHLCQLYPTISRSTPPSLLLYHLYANSLIAKWLRNVRSGVQRPIHGQSDRRSTVLVKLVTTLAPELSASLLRWSSVPVGSSFISYMMTSFGFKASALG